LRERIAAGDFPSAIYLVAERGKIIFSDVLGNAVIEPETIAARWNTIYDMASVTKVLIAGLLCARLIEEKRLRLEDTIAQYFPEFDIDEKRDITVAEILTHSSGIRAWLPFYALAKAENREAKKQRIIELIAAEPLAAQPYEKVIYSDPNFILLGFLIEKIYGERIDVVAEREIFQPLGLRRTFYNPPADLKREIAANERGNNFEIELAAINNVDLGDTEMRSELIWGEVHDGNAYFLDGVSGHAGLFSTAEEAFRIAQQFLPGSTQLLNPETCALFRTNLTPRLNEARSVSFQLAETIDSTASEAMNKDSFGHLGFTGTSVWIEPETERIFILLTNRAHAHGLPFININPTRREFHRRAINALNTRIDGKIPLKAINN
jgi:CubicO group peptidase (beta-lactamase class C family)